jgi:methyl-accepting chemotaxis protein
MRLETKLVASFMVLGLVPALILGWVGFQRSAAELEVAAANRLQEAAVAYGETIDRSLYERYGDVPDFADNPLARSDDPTARQEFVDHLMLVHPDYELILITDTSGRITTISGKDRDGNKLDSSGLVGASVVDTDWYQTVVIGQLPLDNVHYSEAHYNPMVESVFGERRLTLPFTAPIYDGSGTLVGAWHNEVSFDRIVSDVMAEARHALADQGVTTVETKVLRSDGVVLDSADRSTIGRLNLAEEGQEAALLAIGTPGSHGATVEPNIETGVEQINGYAVTDGAHSFAGYNWGVLVRQDSAEAGAPAAGIRDLMFTIGLAIMAGTALIGWWLARGIVRPLNRNVDLLEAVSHGDLTVEVDNHRRDEIGQMSSALDRALHSISGTLCQVEHSTADLTTSASQLSAVSRDMSSTAHHTSEQANDVAAEAERISDSSTSVAQAMDEMSSSIREISNNTATAARMTAQAVDVSTETRKRVEKLDASAVEIGDVVSLITSIAEQTDLLALNATIEAHRVGDAGKGFAVVANEVKALAAQTAGATDQIRTSIETIQNDAVHAVQAITEINDLVEKVNEIAVTTAGAIEEQSATSAEVSSQIQTVTSGTVNISQSISAVARATGDTNKGADTTLRSADQLTRLADGLSQVLAHFTLPVSESGPCAPRPGQAAEAHSGTDAVAGLLPAANIASPANTANPANTAINQPVPAGSMVGSTSPDSIGLEEDLLEAGWQ